LARGSACVGPFGPEQFEQQCVAARLGAAGCTGVCRLFWLSLFWLSEAGAFQQDILALYQLMQASYLHACITCWVSHTRFVN
jgi:hypothetical protein